jgi:hypothetical protein
MWRILVGIICKNTACFYVGFNPLNAELNPICHLLTLLGAHHILHVSRIRVKCLCFMDVQNEVNRCLKKHKRTDPCLLWPHDSIWQAQYGVGFLMVTWGETYQSPKVYPKVLPIWWGVFTTCVYNTWLRMVVLCVCYHKKEKKWERSHCLGMAGCMYSCILYDQNCRSGFVTERAHLWRSCFFRSG